jgi:hypothetical protein
VLASKGDYFHGGMFYDLEHARIFTSLAMLEDVDINTTHLEDYKKTPHSDIKEDGIDAEIGVG